MSKKKKLHILLRAFLPFILLVGITTGIYFWFFAPKDYVDLVPGNSKAVIEINLGELATNKGILSLIEEETGLNKAGIDATCPAYFFVSANEYFGFVAKLHAEKDINAHIRQLVKAKKADMLPSNNGSQAAWIRSGWLLSWNKNSLLLLGPGTAQEQAVLKQTAAQIYKANRAKSFRHSDNYDKFQTLQGEHRIFATLDALPAPLGTLFRANIPASIKTSKLQLFASLKVKDGIVMEGQFQGCDEETQKKLESEGFATQLRKDDILPLMVSSQLCGFAAQSNNDDLLKILRTDEVTKSMLLNLDKKIDETTLQGGNNTYLLSIRNFSKDKNAEYSLSIKRNDSTLYASRTQNMQEETDQDNKVSTSVQTAFGKGEVQSMFSLQLHRLWKDSFLDDNIKSILKSLLGDASAIHFFNRKGNQFELQIF